MGRSIIGLILLALLSTPESSFANAPPSDPNIPCNDLSAGDACNVEHGVDDCVCQMKPSAFCPQDQSECLICVHTDNQKDCPIPYDGGGCGCGIPLGTSALGLMGLILLGIRRMGRRYLSHN